MPSEADGEDSPVSTPNHCFSKDVLQRFVDHILDHIVGNLTPYLWGAVEWAAQLQIGSSLMCDRRITDPWRTILHLEVIASVESNAETLIFRMMIATI